MSTFDGFIKEIDWVSVDRFESENIKDSTTYFLSHCHTDHMHGLNRPGFLKNTRNHYLYCSEVTALILKNLGFHSFTDKVRTLELCRPTIIQVPKIDDEGSPQEVMVTLLPAGHCPGSTMIFFETHHEKILYTGDFRVRAEDLSKYPNLHYKGGKLKEINSLYIDTTFWSPVQDQFPSRDESLQLIIHAIEKWTCQESDGQIHIDRPARIGSEYIAIALSRKFKTKIHISEEAYKIYQGIVQIEDCVTLDGKSTKLHMCEHFGPRRHGRKLRCSPSYIPVLYIRPTAQWYATGAEYLPIKHDKKNSFIQISLSMHASRKELISVLTYLKPKKAVACVKPAHLTQEQIDEELNSVVQGTYRCEDFRYSCRFVPLMPNLSMFSNMNEEQADQETDYET